MATQFEFCNLNTSTEPLPNINAACWTLSASVTTTVAASTRLLLRNSIDLSYDNRHISQILVFLNHGGVFYVP